MWRELWNDHRGKTVGVIAGVFFGLIYLLVGFWDALIFAFIVTVGYYIGNKVDKKEQMMSLQDMLSYLSQKWKMFR